MRITEQRRFPRLACQTPVQYRHLRQPQASYTGALTHDVSAGGLKLSTSEWLPVQDRLLIQLTLPGTVAPIRTIAQVVWARKRPHGDHYEIGARFIGLTPEDLGAVAAYVERGSRV